jgi:hypothetical protein
MAKVKKEKNAQIGPSAWQFHGKEKNKKDPSARKEPNESPTTSRNNADMK